MRDQSRESWIVLVMLPVLTLSVVIEPYSFGTAGAAAAGLSEPPAKGAPPPADDKCRELLKELVDHGSGTDSDRQEQARGGARTTEDYRRAADELYRRYVEPPARPIQSRPMDEERCLICGGSHSTSECPEVDKARKDLNAIAGRLLRRSSSDGAPWPTTQPESDALLIVRKSDLMLFHGAFRSVTDENEKLKRELREMRESIKPAGAGR